jgi:hypothetical protein
MSNFVLILLTLIAAFLLGMWCGWPLHGKILKKLERDAFERERRNAEVAKMIDQTRLDKWREMARREDRSLFTSNDILDMVAEIDRLRSIIGKLDDERKKEFFEANPGL